MTIWDWVAVICCVGPAVWMLVLAFPLKTTCSGSKKCLWCHRYYAFGQDWEGVSHGLCGTKCEDDYRDKLGLPPRRKSWFPPRRKS